MTTGVRPEPAIAEIASAASSPLSSRRIALQRRATKTIRRHFLRDATRVATLMAGDLASFVALRVALDTVRTGAAPGTYR